MTGLMTVTESEYHQLMGCIADEIYDLARRYRDLQGTKDSWNDSLLPSSRTCGLTLDEITDLQIDLATRQHQFIKQWHSMNHRLQTEGRAYYTPAKGRELGYLIKPILKRKG